MTPVLVILGLFLNMTALRCVAHLCTEHDS
jgi:hypothetical protein